MSNSQFFFFELKMAEEVLGNRKFLFLLPKPNLARNSQGALNVTGLRVDGCRTEFFIFHKFSHTLKHEPRVVQIK
jgi:hypothetical protein